MKATEGVKHLECSPEEPPGVRGVERMEGNGGNRGGPPRPGTLRSCAGARRPITGEEPGSGRLAGKESEGVVVPLEPSGQQNRRRWEGPLLHPCVLHREGPVSA